MCNKSENNGSIRIHFIYVTIILVAIIVIISACRLSDNQQITSIVSFAGTVTSIILSVLAIFITVLSNDSMSGLMEKIRSLTDTIRPAEDHLKKASDKIENTISGLETIKGKLKDASDMIETSTKDLSEKICGQLNEGFLSLEKSMQSNNHKQISQPCELNVDLFINTTSYWGIILLYTLYLCQERSKIFDIVIFSDKFEKRISRDYIYGYLVASSSAGYFNFEKDNESNLLTNISMSKELKKEQLKARIEEINKVKAYPIDISVIDSLVNDSFSDGK